MRNRVLVTVFGVVLRSLCRSGMIYKEGHLCHECVYDVMKSNPCGLMMHVSNAAHARSCVVMLH